MQSEDLPHVNLVLSNAFTQALLRDGFSNSRVPLCREEFLQMYLAANPKGAFVITEADRVVAFCFSRLPGRVGWLGPLAVLPACAGKGLGKMLVRGAVASLQRDGAQVIGLETPAYSGKNLAFYSRLGFETGCVVADLLKWFPATQADTASDLELLRYSGIAPDQQLRFFNQMRALTQEVEPLLDYKQEVELAVQFGFGDAVLLLQDGQPRGLALLHTETYSVEEKRHFLKIVALQMSPRLPPEELNTFLALLQNLGRKEGLSGIFLRVALRYRPVFLNLLQQGFQVVRNDLRLTFAGYPEKTGADLVNINKWQ